MRPVLLELRGFASFRESAVVDFRGADFFALVGPTGAGKSTIIDALTFALYGSVPRWNNKAAISFALAPTTTQAVVRLVFDVGPQRYVVAREVRRVGKAGNPTMRACRLERLADPAGLGAAEEETHVLEADSRVTGAVERLLGLTFDDFCQCVVLPQGEFAEFLRATPKNRQDILLKLLGAERYDLIRQQANTRAAAAAQQVAFLTEQAAALADATDEAVAAAEADERAVADCGEQVQSLLPRMRAAGARVAQAAAGLTRLRAEHDTLAAVRAPTDVEVLDAEMTGAETARRTAAEREALTQTQEAAARRLVDQEPPRVPLERAREDYVEQARLLAEMPGISVDHQAAAAAVVAAERAQDAAFAERERAREALARASEAAQAAESRRARLETEHTIVSAVRRPAGLADLATRLADAAQELERLRQRLAGAEEAAESARTAAESGAGLARLEVVREAVEALRERYAALPAAQRAHERAAADHAEAAAVLAAATDRLTRARDGLEVARRADLASGLRRHLHVGEACPVCGQDVVSAPPQADTTMLQAAEQAVAAGEQEVAEAAAVVAAAMAAEASTSADLAAARQAASAAYARTRDAVDRAGMTSQLALIAPGGQQHEGVDERVLADLGTAVHDLSRAVADQMEEAGQREARRAEALAEVAACRSDLRAAQARDQRLQQEAAAARAALRTARDPLVALGAPPVDDEDPASGWTALAAWAETQALERSTALRAANADVVAARAAEQEAAKTDQLAQRTLHRAARQHRDAVDTAARASADLANRQVRLAELACALDGAPSEQDVAATLLRIDSLERAAAQAYRLWQDARAALDTAEGAVLALAAQADSGWATLRAVRDGLVALGAPDVVGHHPGGSAGLSAAWHTLQSWAAAQAQLRTSGLPGAERDLADATASAQVMADEVRMVLAGIGVALAADDGEDLLAQAPAAVAAAGARAGAATQRVRERRSRAVQFRHDCAQATEREQVARTLGGLLRSDNFPRWLEAAALDVLVVDASHALLELSSGQFELTHDNREFFVVDHADADSRRSVRTLSGGETFQASLALALALSSQLSTLSGAAAARLDSIFLDEGFGTLDPVTLEVVAATLENLAQTDRMVGVVTHVSALAERIPVRYRVQRDGRTSSVVREG